MQHIAYPRCDHFAAGIAGCGDDGLEPCKTVHHGICLIQNDLVIEPFDDCFDEIVVHQDLGGGIWFSLNPYLHPPSMAVEAATFTLIMEKAMGRVKKDLLIDATFHCTAFVGGGYKIISSHIKTDKESGG